MKIDVYETQRVKPGSIVSGNQMRYLAASELPMSLQAVMVQLFSKTDWALASRGHLQTIPVRYKLIADALCVSVRSVKRYVASLIQMGELEGHKQFGDFGQQLANVFTMPKLAAHLKSLNLKEIEDEIGQDTPELPHLEAGGDSEDTPYKQNSSTKRNTYIRFKKIREKEEFLAIRGSIRYVPQICKVIQKARPKVDPDLVYNWFKQFISRPEFVLLDHIPSYFTLLRIFARKVRLPGEHKPGAEPVLTKPDPVPTPSFAGDFAELRKELCNFIGAASYIAWFGEAKFTADDHSKALKLSVSTNFIKSYVQTSFGDLLDELSARRGFRSSLVMVEQPSGNGI